MDTCPPQKTTIAGGHLTPDLTSTKRNLTLPSVIITIYYIQCFVPSVLRRCWLGGRKDIGPVTTEWWGADIIICLGRGADLHMAQLMPLPLNVSCFSEIQIGFTFPFCYRLTRVVPDKGPLNGCVCVCV